MRLNSTSRPLVTFVEPGDATATPVVFARMWEQELAFTEGKPVTLGQTGVQVTITCGAPFSVVDYWMICVRPTASGDIFPRRYLEAPQPPDGPRLWACPLS